MGTRSWRKPLLLKSRLLLKPCLWLKPCHLAILEHRHLCRRLHRPIRWWRRCSESLCNSHRLLHGACIQGLHVRCSLLWRHWLLWLVSLSSMLSEIPFQLLISRHPWRWLSVGLITCGNALLLLSGQTGLNITLLRMNCWSRSCRVGCQPLHVWMCYRFVYRSPWMLLQMPCRPLAF